MPDSGVYLRTPRGTIDLVYETTSEEFRDWIGTMIANSGGVFAVDGEVEFDVDMRFDMLCMLEEHGIIFYFSKGEEYARIAKGRSNCN